MERMDKLNRKAGIPTILTFKLGESNFAISINCVVRVEQAQAVSEIISTVQELAEQSNMLVANAAIQVASKQTLENTHQT